MTFSLPQLLVFIFGYLSMLFAVGYLAERGKIPQRVLNHPATYVLSLGVLFGPFAVYAIVELAFQYGYSFLLYYMGVTLMLLLSPLLLHPLMRVCRIYQLSSLADLLSFRFRSQWVGALVTLIMVAAMLPLLALQIQAVSDSIHILAGDSGVLLPGIGRHDGLALLFCAIITLFAILFGTRHLSAQRRNNGLVAAIAFESLLKLIAMLSLGLGAVYGVFGGFTELDSWLTTNPHIVDLLDSPLRQDSARALLLIFFAGAVVMPHMFHMTFTESGASGSLRGASWGLPLFLLLLSLPVLPITWAGLHLDSGLPQVYSVLTIGMELQSAPLALTAFAAGLSAASAVIIVSTLALANMCLNYLVLPMQLRHRGPLFDTVPDIYGQLRWLRRLLIAAIITAGYFFYRTVDGQVSLVDLGLTAFIGTLQFLPGVLASVYWPSANRKGLIAGLLGGFATWFFALLLPMISDFDPRFIQHLYLIWFDDVESVWSAAAIGSLAINVSLFIVVSLLTRSHPDEAMSAEICSMDDLNRPMRQTLGLSTAEEFKSSLASALGDKMAAVEVERALHELQLTAQENRPYALRRLRRRIEANLSGLLGPAVAYEILQHCIPWQLDNPEGSEDISLIENRLDNAHIRFTGLAADLDNLRRYHRETLQQLPIGVLSLGLDGEVLMWNNAMESTTGVKPEAIVGSYLSSLPGAWARTLGEFVRSGKDAEHRLHLPPRASGELSKDSQGRWISLHKAAVASSSRVSDDQVILVEDLTDYQMLEQELLHNERLASIGRLAAGVAHEIGNPITGIACLAQNLEYEDNIGAVQEAAGDILKQTDRVTRIVESLVNFSHTGSDHADVTPMAPTNLADCVDEAIHLLQLDHSAKSVQFDNVCNREQLVLAESQKLLQVFVNLLGNARDASDEGGAISIESDCEDETATIIVTDFGCGIPSAIQGQIFEPFFTTKDPGQGTGLGLSVVYSILEDMQGNIHLDSPLPDGSSGSRFYVQLAAATYNREYL